MADLEGLARRVERWPQYLIQRERYCFFITKCTPSGKVTLVEGGFRTSEEAQEYLSRLAAALRARAQGGPDA